MRAPCKMDTDSLRESASALSEAISLSLSSSEEAIVCIQPLMMVIELLC